MIVLNYHSSAGTKLGGTCWNRYFSLKNN